MDDQEHDDYVDPPQPPCRLPPVWVLRLLACVFAPVLLLVVGLVFAIFAPTIDEFLRD